MNENTQTPDAEAPRYPLRCTSQGEVFATFSQATADRIAEHIANRVVEKILGLSQPRQTPAAEAEAAE